MLDRLNADPAGELVITVPTAALDPLATVLVVDFEHLDQLPDARGRRETPRPEPAVE